MAPSLLKGDVMTELDKLKKDLEIALREETRWKSLYNNARQTMRNQYNIIQQIKEVAFKTNVDCIFRISVIRKILGE